MYLSENVIDISGVPQETIYLSLVCFNSHYKSKILKDFYEKFPRLKSSSIKGTNLEAPELKKIVLFLDENQVKMFSTCFKSESWRERLLEHQAAQHESHWKEKTIAMLMFRLLKNYCYAGMTRDKNGVEYVPEYNITIDEKSNFNMNIVLENCRRLCKGRKINVSFLTAKAKFCAIMRFADYVAAAHRKVGGLELSKLKNFRLITPDFSEREKTRALRFSKRSGKK